MMTLSAPAAQAAIAVNATKRLLDNLATSDFVLICGQKAVDELRGYGADIASDIYTAVCGHHPSEEVTELLVAALPSHGREDATPEQAMRDLIEQGTQAHGDEFYGPILEQLNRMVAQS